MRTNVSAVSPPSPPPQVRTIGKDPSATTILAQAAGQLGPHLSVGDVAAITDSDYAQIDPTLTVNGGDARQTSDDLVVGLGYAGLSPGQRNRFVSWLDHPLSDAPTAFQHLCVANLEVRLLESKEWQEKAHAVLREIAASPAWQNNEMANRAILLACWLAQDGKRVADWIESGQTPPGLLGLALGCQAILQTPLTANAVAVLARAWRLPNPDLDPIVVELRLASLNATLGVDALAHALAVLPESARQPRPWRCTHRELRIIAPQPDVSATLRPLLGDLLVVLDAPTDETSQQQPNTGDEQMNSSNEWELILEFGHSRSEFFETVVRQAQRLSGYTALMDEHRHIVYRVHFRKSGLHRFWSLWDYTQTWADTHVYLNGKELEKWKIWPYSQYMN